jgi:hypothetical protein
MARLPLICALLFISVAFCRAANDDGLRRTLSDLARKKAIKALKEKKFTVAKFGFTGTLEAVAPEKNLNIQVKDFSLGNDTVKVNLQAAGLFRLAGKYILDGAHVDFDAQFLLEIMPTVKAPIVKRGNDFFVKPSVADLDFRLELKEIKPEALADGKTLVTDILNSMYKTQKKSILQAINVSLGEKKL